VPVRRRGQAPHRGPGGPAAVPGLPWALPEQPWVAPEASGLLVAPL
jgi:hypothetical protein